MRNMMAYRKSSIVSNRRSGFTLLELIVVIIIVGVIAGFALPRFFGAIQRSYATEALNMLGTIRRAIAQCMSYSDPGTGFFPHLPICDEFHEFGIDNPAFALPPANFSYTIVHGAGLVVITARRTGVNGGDGVSTIVLEYDLPTGVSSVQGTGIFVNVQ